MRSRRRAERYRPLCRSDGSISVEETAVLKSPWQDSASNQKKSILICWSSFFPFQFKFSIQNEVLAVVLSLPASISAEVRCAISVNRKPIGTFLSLLTYPQRSKLRKIGYS